MPLKPSTALFLLALLLSPLALLSTTWLYLYPILHGCDFPVPDSTSSSRSSSDSNSNSRLPARAPFRLLALGDPQLEGSTALPYNDGSAFPSLQGVTASLRSLRDSETWHDRSQNLYSATRNLCTVHWNDVSRDLGKWLAVTRKKIDLWGNDFYLAHVVRQTRWWTQPTHVTVLGDLLGSQWIEDGEFEERVGRYWGRVFRGLERVDESIMTGAVEGDEGGGQEEGQEGEKKWGKGRKEVLGEDEAWGRRVINIAGNHDIGYAGDIDERRIERFERAFGRVNWDVEFVLPGYNVTSSDPKSTPAATEEEDAIPQPPSLRLVILNSMNLDAPALSDPLQRETYSFLNHIISTSRPVTDKTHATILLTHIPLHKEQGICVDAPFFDYFHEFGGGVKEQNMLSTHASKTILEGLFGLSGYKDSEGAGFGRKGVILNGHDHEGCDVLHYVAEKKFACGYKTWRGDVKVEVNITDAVESSSENTEGEEGEKGGADEQGDKTAWNALRIPTHDPFPLHPTWDTEFGKCLPYQDVPAIREITLRSMMGEFAGYAGFLSAWFDEGLGEKGEWRLEFVTCGAGVQHWWWAGHVLDLIVVVLLVLGLLVWVLERVVGLVRGSAAEAKVERRRGGEKRGIQEQAGGSGQAKKGIEKSRITHKTQR